MLVNKKEKENKISDKNVFIDLEETTKINKENKSN